MRPSLGFRRPLDCSSSILNSIVNRFRPTLPTPLQLLVIYYASPVQSHSALSHLTFDCVMYSCLSVGRYLASPRVQITICIHVTRNTTLLSNRRYKSIHTRLCNRLWKCSTVRIIGAPNACGIVHCCLSFAQPIGYK
ncbi:hypothetical protein M404DRAFT_317536 [Pisolithus tinctorius Marx 270]|uniref:Uncharacterized protein n=1 Tax=Pisolithus tinctorius Marx 270 TaxID=870435 RepID=A0A0C3N2Y2_PISTI|nr:hypothetical protein M404DRAFT_317536 [Pisolithus tinctorius Marx 270]